MQRPALHKDEPRPSGGVVKTDLPARMDRLPWSTWHWLVVIALGITWVLDGLEVTLNGAVSGVLLHPETLGLTSTQIGMLATSYLAGAVLGALFFGYLTDRLGRRRLFLTTLTVYLTATALTAISWNFWSMAVFRFCTGAGIGGEYAAINSAIDELIPARVRGRTDLIINSTFWIGTALGSAASIVFLNERYLPIDFGWRLGFLLGATLGLIIIVLRRFIPESPRWLMTHGRLDEAEKTVAAIEDTIRNDLHIEALPGMTYSVVIGNEARVRFTDICRVILRDYRRRSILCLSLMLAQAFFYNGIFFTYPLVLTVFYSVRPERIGIFLLPFALGNVLGPLTLGHLFDTVGRKPMIALTYSLSAILLIATAVLFIADALSPLGQTVAWVIIFFIASSAASAAYLTVSEIFPIEIRAVAIALFYALGTGIGGVVAPALFGALIQTGVRANVAYGYFIGAALMLAAAAIEIIFGVKAERRPLEEIAPPMSSESDIPG